MGLHLHLLTSLMNFLMARLSLLAMNVSVPLRPSSSLPSLVWNLLVSMRLATLTSGRISSPTLSCLVAPPCMLVLLIVCRRKSLLLLLLSVNTLYGSVAPSLLLYPLSRPCGSPRRNTKNPAQALSTASASKKHILLYFIVIVIENGYFYMSNF